MTRLTQIAHEFVEFVPETLEEGKLYVSVQYGTATHLCACGCGSKVITPITPTDWTLVFDGETVSLDPSIGSWSLPCRSHYWIQRGRVRWAARWSNDQVEAGRARDRSLKDAYFEKPDERPSGGDGNRRTSSDDGRLWRLLRRLRRR